MTRRKFIEKLIKTSSSFIVLTLCLLKKAKPRKFTRALRSKIYPGTVVSTDKFQKINKMGKWSG